MRTSEGKINVNLIVFIAMSFVLSMMAMVFNGILDIIAVSMNVPIANTGLLNSTYAYGGAIGVPITLILFRKIERTKMLKMMLLLTIFMNFALIYTGSFNQLLIIRFISGITGNSYSVLATATVAALAFRDKLGHSLALLIMGNSLALVLGIPLTRVLSATLSWQSIFWILSGMMIAALLYFIKFLPATNKEITSVDFRNELVLVKDRETLLVILSTLITFIGYGAFYKYVTPYLIKLFPTLEPIMSIILIAIGIASFTGNLIGGYFADRIGYEKSLLLGSIMQAVFALFIILTQSVQWGNLLALLLWQINSWFIGLQVNTGINYATDNKSSFVLSINTSSLQFGTATGASIDALIIANIGMASIIYVSLITSTIVTLLQWKLNS